MGTNINVTHEDIVSNSFYRKILDYISKYTNSDNSSKNVKAAIATVAGFYTEFYERGFEKLDLAILDTSDLLNSVLWPLVQLITGDGKKIGKDFDSVILLAVWLKGANPEAVDQRFGSEFMAPFLYRSTSILIRKLLLLTNNNKHSVKLIETLLECRVLLRFLIDCFQNFEYESLRKCCLSIVSPLIWYHLPSCYRSIKLFGRHEMWSKLYARVIANTNKLCEKIKKSVEFSAIIEGNVHYDLENVVINRDFIHILLKIFMYLLDLSKEDDNFDSTVVTPEFQSKIMLLETILELFNDLISQMPTRRIIKPLLDANFFLVLCKRSPMYSHLQGTYFKKMTDILDFYLSFPISEETGLPIEYDKQLSEHYKRFEQFQKIIFHEFKHVDLLENMHLESVNTFSTEKLEALFDKLKLKVLLDLTSKLEIVYLDDLSQQKGEDNYEEDKSGLELIVPFKIDIKRTNKEIKSFLTFLLVNYLSKPADPKLRIINDPVYPNEDYLWNSGSIPVNTAYVDYSSLPLPKLTLQYLSVYDYLYRNYQLYRLEAGYQIKSDLEETIYRMKPVCSLGLNGKFTAEQLRGYRDSQTVANTRFLNASRMGIRLESVVITNVYKPQVGIDAIPKVTADLYVDLSELTDYTFRDDWDSLRTYDVLFLVSIAAPLEFTEKRIEQMNIDEIPLNLGIMGVRGAQIISIADENGMIFSDSNPYEPKLPSGTKRCISVYLDYAQYELDLKEDIEGIYSNCNLLLRRHARFNNFKSTLDTIKGLVSNPGSLASWLEPFFLGYGHPNSLKYFASNLDTPALTLNWLNILHDLQHLVSSFPSILYYELGQEFDVNKLQQINVSNITFKTIVKHDNGIKFKVKKNIPLQYVQLVVDNIISYEYSDQPASFQAKLIPKETKNTKVTIKGYLDFTLEIHNCTVEMHGIVFEHNNKIYNPIWRAEMESNINELENNLFTTHPLYPNTNYPLKGIHIGTTSSDIPLHIRLTDRQVEAIYSAVQCGMTCIMGPPGTGKTDVVAQAINILYTNYPNEKIVVLAHSNQCLNDIFEKILQSKYVDQRYLVRLGMGERKLDLQYGQDFGKWGRVNYMLQSRLDLLEYVGKLAKKLRVEGDVDYTVQLALQFYQTHIIHRLIDYKSLLLENKTYDEVLLDMRLDCCIYSRNGLNQLGIDPKMVGFCEYLFLSSIKTQFSVDGPLKAWAESLENFSSYGSIKDNILQIDMNFEGIFKFVCINNYAIIHPQHALSLLNLPKYVVFNPFDRDDFMKIQDIIPLIDELDFTLSKPPAVNCYPVTTVLDTFCKLKECLPFEVLRSNTDRGHYLITRHARIVAMTCTHAAIARERLIESNFTYDTLVMEEAAQVLEIETFIPLTLQLQGDKLKRIVLIGDNRQLPPIIQNRTVASYCKLDQSFYTRVIRLQHPCILLNSQGRSRPEIVSLYSHYYPEPIGNVGLEREEFGRDNLGFRYNYQFINVDSERGESCPIPHFYQNLEEAEYVIALFTYMRMIGYDSNKITILTTYNGQRALIEDVMKHKCAWNPRVGTCAVSTVDKFQGQQNDYIIISLVRTRMVGHIRDPRRLTVALSRARLGLYIFGKWDLFYNCYEIRQTLDKLAFENKLVLDDNKCGESQPHVIDNCEQLQKIVQQMQ
ncbi:intron-binding protein aquarius [Babesia microti strain RI]|uniref:Intron-binding protein aquarius n=1 Tax=Babesia microti (strain RI) TaxID=1133968 RepID=I7IQ72_BABMR|nr:intron-binding protein aquarius [Babesia microti strain RI]CCF73550.1 intron-binding protein aquarius [Babesia microti strain RI]|eukprot:XP_012648159.1 intron-binding protein aquarius [Babesia microti strain RI]